ncbi:unnamed protein product [Vitrella brassicaformis CCMP3155]|uniref:Uncharacterized protein n=2 Tax=Vitrella brassicaformis TaxID=1169539 RepID=A0A0G4ENE4_VITBC|nr:unnamed protein product [Vitrella brassicaformis CCMP3155]|eukprot:CEL98924.1 unnamed protein product [Vitrella brassicaformis CCMP3155]
MRRQDYAALPTDGTMGPAPPSKAEVNTQRFIDSCRLEYESEEWSFPGWGSQYTLNTGIKGMSFYERDVALGELEATAICGNDITSSCFYATGELIKESGMLAPICSLFAALTLLLFRFIYGEVVMALPLNGGVYNCLLNSSQKSTASVAACLTILSYIATGVVSAVSAVNYLVGALASPGGNALGIVLDESFNVVPIAIAILAVFAILQLIGLKESSFVAVLLFIAHLTVLAVLTTWAISFLVAHGPQPIWNTIKHNFAVHMKLIRARYFVDEALLKLENEEEGLGGGTPGQLGAVEGPLGTWGMWSRALAAGFSAAMLGTSGFETSANFVEDQKAGVFPLTLRNMWALVSVINPVLSTLTIIIMPLDHLLVSSVAMPPMPLGGPGGGERAGEVAVTLRLLAESTRSDTPHKKAYTYAVAMLADRLGGPWLRLVIAFDAMLVLSGSVLTSYVGVTGLIDRMACDGCLPEWFLEVNPWRGTAHWSILFFFAVCSSMCLVCNGEIDSLAAIYSIAFLLVMCLFAGAGLYLKISRPNLQRPQRYSAWVFVWGFILVAIAFVAVQLEHPRELSLFFFYWFIVVVLVMATFYRTRVAKVIIQLLGFALGRTDVAHSRHSSQRASFGSTSALLDSPQPEPITPPPSPPPPPPPPSTSLLSCMYQSVRCCATCFYAPRSALVTLHDALVVYVQKCRSRSVIFFAKTADLAVLNKAIMYIMANEEARWVRVCHCFLYTETVPKNMGEYVAILDAVYPKIRIDCVFVRGRFGHDVITFLTRELGVTPNNMFISCPTSNFKHRLESLGGVRVILGSDPHPLPKYADPFLSPPLLNTVRRRHTTMTTHAGGRLSTTHSALTDQSPRPARARWGGIPRAHAAFERRAQSVDVGGWGSGGTGDMSGRASRQQPQIQRSGLAAIAEGQQQGEEPARSRSVPPQEGERGVEGTDGEGSAPASATVSPREGDPLLDQGDDQGAVRLRIH